jgi:hypothetical protein
MITTTCHPPSANRGTHANATITLNPRALPPFPPLLGTELYGAIPGRSGQEPNVGRSRPSRRWYDITLLCKVFTQWELSKNLQIVNMNKLDLIYIPFLIPVLAPSYAAKGCAIIYRPSTHSNAVAAVVGHVLEH